MGDEINRNITEISNRVDGLVRVKGYVVFVLNTKGDNVKIKIIQIGSNYVTGEVMQLGWKNSVYLQWLYASVYAT